jgi:hypothetical protein
MQTLQGIALEPPSFNLTGFKRALTGAPDRVRTDVQREGVQWPTTNST